jgi:alcohol dehydrogenase
MGPELLRAPTSIRHVTVSIGTDVPLASTYDHSMTATVPAPNMTSANGEAATMKALVYLGDGKKAFQDKPKPEIIAPTDAIVKIVKTTICGTDLHILKGDVPTAKPGRTLGHEGVGIVDDIGAGVHTFKKGDRVLISCVTSCGACMYCRRLMFSHCTDGGWILGNTIDGTQADFVRIPHADTSLYPILAGENEEPLVMFSDILPTGYECGVLNGHIAPGSVVAIVGSGPIGLAALLTAQFYSPAEIIMIDLDQKRLDIASRFGATKTVNSTDGKAQEAVLALTDQRGVDTAIEAVGIPASFELCEQIVAPGGYIANIGVHGKPATLHLEQLWDRNIGISTRLVDTVSTPTLLKMMRANKIDPKKLITHHFKLIDIVSAYDTFSRATVTGALKVILET